jgi:aminoglycoside phosphotransferase (APT) family kinase protein
VPVWSPDVVVDEPLARRLIGQFPDVELRSLRRFAEGWDNAVWLANERWAFRFPQREISVPGLLHELAVLPEVAGRLPLPVPNPVFVGEPTDGYLWPFFGSELLPGREACDAELDADGRLAVALRVAEFARRLHALEPPVQLPGDVNRRADTTKRVPHARTQLAEVERLGLWRVPRRVHRLLDEAEQRLPPPEPPVLVHGDLHFRHVLVDDGGAASGIIDWGDVCLADPAIDLQLVWSFLEPEQRGAFLDAYGRPVSEAQLVRARVLALSLCAALAAYGHGERMVSVEREALDGLARAALD